MKIAVIGGSRGLGEWIAQYLKTKKLDVTITGRDQIAGAKIAQKLGVKYCSDNIKAAVNSDVVIIAVPIETTATVIKEVAPHLQKGSLLLDVTSVKENPSLLMNELVPEGVDFLPTHPMFGPRIRSLEGQVVVLTPLKKSKWFDKVFNFLKENKARVLVTTPQKHDEMMSVVQVLTHFAYISIASTIEKLQVDIKESRQFASPIYSLMVDIISRIVAQNPYLAYSIQTQTEYAEKSRQKFIEASNELSQMLSQKNQEEFVDAMTSAAKNLDDLEAALGRSDKAISAINHEITILKESLGNEVGVRHIYSGKVHLGTLKDLSPDFLTLDTGKKVLKLKIANIEVLSPQEVWNWKLDKFPHYTYDISAVFPENCDPQIIADTITNIKGIINTSVQDIYQGDQIEEGKISITFRFEVLHNDLIKEVEDLLTGFGGIVR